MRTAGDRRSRRNDRHDLLTAVDNDDVIICDEVLMTAPLWIKFDDV